MFSGLKHMREPNLSSVCDFSHNRHRFLCFEVCIITIKLLAMQAAAFAT